MKKILTLIVGVVSLLLIANCAKDEENLSGSISGIVTEYANANTPIPGATVTLNGKGLSKTTGSDGRFEFTGLEPGTYTLAVNANNYKANTKQVTVYAGQKANCDIQLEVEKVDVEISPLNLVFDKTVDMLSFTISNKSNQTLSYNLAAYMQDLLVSPMLGSIQAKGQQTISVKVSNRSSIKKTVSGQILVNIGSDSYQVNVTVNGTEEQVSTGKVMGTISDYANANSPIAGATVTLASTGESKTTGSDGRYEFKDLSPGVYTITVSANNYEGAKKDVNIEANKTVTCDFQLQKGATDVEVTPQNLTYASDVDQLSFTIKNGSSSTQQYTLSNVPDFVSVSSSTGMISSRGSEAITVTVLNRKQITDRKNAQMKVTVGNNAFIVNITVEPYQSESVNVDISPTTLNFDKSTEQLTFTITSKNNRSLDYEITNDLSIIAVSPTKGTLRERGQNTITVKVLDRQKVDMDKVGKLTIAIEGNTYVVTVNVAKYDIDVSLSPQSLSFDKDTDNKTLSITNNNDQMLDFSITSNLGELLTVTPSNGNINGKERKDIVVYVKDRKNVTSDKTGQLTIVVGGKTFAVGVHVDKYQGETPSDPENVVRGLVAYYNFNSSNADDAIGNYHGFMNGGSFITDTPSGTGKALYLKQKQYVSIGSAPIDGRTNYTVSMWVKDFGSGCFMLTQKGNYYTAPSLIVTEDVKLKFYTGVSNYSSTSKTYSADMSNFQTGQWVMITIVCEPSGNSILSTLYINGRRVDSGTSEKGGASGGTAMTIGGSYGNSIWAAPMKIDNVRLYSVSLKDDEIAALYDYEK